jgi:hypothetical protein
MINTKLAEKFSKLADGMQKQIDAKMNPATARQNLTRRRAQIIASMRREGERLHKIQRALMAIAAAASNGGLPESLAKVSGRSHIELLLYYRSFPEGQWEGNLRTTLDRLRINGYEAFDRARADLLALCGDRPETEEEKREKELKALELELRLRKEPGFFVTPQAIVEKMIRLAEIGHGHTILEPSAGIGNIADHLPKDQVKVIEWNSSRNRLLALKGYEVVGDDFLEHHGCYDRIIMNPPFENGQDVDPVRHAYQLLNPCGILVSITGEGAFFRSDKKFQAFREWLDDIGWHFIKLPDGSFKESGTGVSSRIVFLRKPGEERMAA